MLKHIIRSKFGCLSKDFLRIIDLEHIMIMIIEKNMVYNALVCMSRFNRYWIGIQSLDMERIMWRTMTGNRIYWRCLSDSNNSWQRFLFFGFYCNMYILRIIYLVLDNSIMIIYSFNWNIFQYFTGTQRHFILKLVCLTQRASRLLRFDDANLAYSPGTSSG